MSRIPSKEEIRAYYEAEPKGDFWIEDWEEVRLRHQVMHPFFEEAVAEGAQVVVDVGCGSGGNAKRIQDIFRFPNYIGLDISLTALRRAMSVNVGMVRCAVGDATTLPLATSLADLVLCSEVLEHIPDWRIALREIERILKPRGMLVLTLPNYWYLPICIRSLVGKKYTTQIYDRPMPYQLLVDELTAIGFDNFQLEFFLIRIPRTWLPSTLYWAFSRLVSPLARLLPLLFQVYLVVSCRAGSMVRSVDLERGSGEA
jgi:ubiquinone/menaquinone biosynthesis C-methylase UbiE